MAIEPPSHDIKYRNGPSPIDLHVGSRIRSRRQLCGMSQESLGQVLNLTFQQVQKYECGTNRVGASRLFEISRILDVPVSYFFDDMTDDVARSPISGPRGRMQIVQEQTLVTLSNHSGLASEKWDSSL
jgi:transcriptional regulator with XRE-family HTH domain